MVQKLTNPKAIDMECLMSTKEGAVSRDPAMIEALQEYFKTAGMRIKSEDGTYDRTFDFKYG